MHRERGVVLFIALIALVAMALAGIATMRSVSAGLLVAGNLAYKRQATTAADRGIEQARAWYGTYFGSAFDTSEPANGYYAEWDDFDPATADWTIPSKTVLVPWNQLSAGAQEVRYVIHRLCQDPGAASPTTCVMADSLAGSSTSVGASYGSKPLTGSGRVYYRITARVVGAKGTVSLVQTTMY